MCLDQIWGVIELYFSTNFHNLFSFLGKGQDVFIFVMLVFVEMFLLTAETAETRIPFSKRPRHIYLHHVPVILLMLTAESLMLDNSSKCFSDSFQKIFKAHSSSSCLRSFDHGNAQNSTDRRLDIFKNVFRFFRHEDFRDDLEASLDAKSLSNVSICKRKNKLNYWTILQNVFRFFQATGQGTFTFIISRNFAHDDFYCWTNFHNLFSFLGKGQDVFIFVMLIFVEMFLMVI